MIKIEIYEKNSKIVKIECIGHANNEHNGSDLLCALISSINTHTINVFQEILHTHDLKYRLESGFFEIELNNHSEDEKADLIMRSLSLYYQELLHEFGEYMEIFYKEV